ncbi:MAG: Coenzyme F420 hydrogenase/dehydrogenase, beta subunit C-terminal domain [Candidatus Bathyarchaeota archaeon]|nr:Coenzyme F420 hydrogenase/dehydrogenase, beta subunit C-terminal domain [Candidatus Bathyarchaeota archaeon]MCX8177074.1 Coenzyme F420 hydrogenase/dehydrogenase, beta subunit C-terminal domain [Candidatus Bathyarchaeota archaeon]MDW8194187.1 Coenzyme F420 hydrogenase/dehydrogenase, beta subunit C-terminal domain [Nitrososphaerota archaeon]
MAFNKISFEESLGKNVVAAERCIGCGTCILVCPYNCLEYREGIPVIVKECKVCGICARACPQNEWSQSEVEKAVFNREKQPSEEFGVYRKLVIARAKDEAVQKVAQDGGAVTALLTFGLKSGIFDGAIASGKSRDKPLYPAPMLATSLSEILEGAGTRYTYSPNILALAEAVKQKKHSLAFVGTPCQIRAVRKLQMAGLKRYTAPIKLSIGLMCSESFTYEGLIEGYIRGKLGINPEEISKMNIKGKMLVTTKSGVKAIPLAEVKPYVRKGCGYCQDFSSELADISAGGLGLDGWTFIIIRTETGEKIFESAEKAGFLETRSPDEKEPAMNLLLKLSSKKRKAPAA